VAEIAQLGER